MKRKRTPLSCLLALLAVGCQPPAPAEMPASVARPPARPAAAADTARVVSEPVVGQLFAALAYKKLRPMLKTYTKSVALTPSADAGQPADSTVTYSAGPNSFVYVQRGDEAALLRCQVAARPAPPTASIRLGMSRAALGKAVAHTFSTGVLLVSEEEGYQKFYFTLKSDTLQALHFESDYLD